MQFGLLEMWAAMGAVAKTVAIMLIAMSVLTIYMLIERLLVFTRATKKSCEEAPKLAELLKSGNLKDALPLSSKKDFKGSHLARVTQAGIQAIIEGKEAKLSMEEQLETATRARERAKTLFNQELRPDLYRESGYSGIKITLPEQELERGEVTFKVVEPRIGRVLVEGNQHFSANNVRRSVPSLQPGQSPMTREIAASVRVANVSPAKQSAVLLRPGAGDSEVDAVIRVADVPPVR